MSLQDASDEIPTAYQNLEEVQASSPTQTSLHTRDEASENRSSLDRGLRVPRAEDSQRSEEQEENYTTSVGDEDCEIPDDYQNLDEFRASSPIQTSLHTRDEAPENRSSLDRGLRVPRAEESQRSEEQEEKYTTSVGDEDCEIPDDYQNLDEFRASSPLKASFDTDDVLKSAKSTRKGFEKPEQQEWKDDSRGNVGSQTSRVGSTINNDAIPTELKLLSPVQTQTSHQQSRPKAVDSKAEICSTEFLSARLSSQHELPQGNDVNVRRSSSDREVTWPLSENRSPPASAHKEGHDQNRQSSSHRRVSKLEIEVYTVSYLIFFSILGTLARLGLEALTLYPGAPVQTSLLWANVGGSLLMGFLFEDRKLFGEKWSSPSLLAKETTGKDMEKNHSYAHFRGSPNLREISKKEHAELKRTIPLYLGLTVGFCGSFTSFSSFLKDAFLALGNALPVPISHASLAPVAPLINVSRNPGYGFMAVTAVIITTTGLCLGALQFGVHLALTFEPIIPAIPLFFVQKIMDRTMVLMAWICWLGTLFIAIFPPDRPGASAGRSTWAKETWRGDAAFALVFAPLGCLLRFYASLHLNGRQPSFPLGTFTVNMLGTAMVGLFFDLQHVPVGDRAGCQVLQGLMDGFCGCLTTVSTWVVELKMLRLKHAYSYGAASIAGGLGLMVIIMGSLQWTTGFQATVCGH